MPRKGTMLKARCSTSGLKHNFHDTDVVGGVNEDQKFIDVRMNAVKRKILILSGKGGEYL